MKIFVVVYVLVARSNSIVDPFRLTMNAYPVLVATTLPNVAPVLGVM